VTVTLRPNKALAARAAAALAVPAAVPAVRREIPVPEVRGNRGSNLTRESMAALLAQGHPVPICLAVLDCLAEAGGWTDMPLLKALMEMRASTQGQPWLHKSYSDPSNALEDNGLLERQPVGRSISSRITPAGTYLLRRHSSTVVRLGRAE
jgi:hypothetical protein